MNDKPTPDEQPKKKVARRVVTEKRQYFVPHHGADGVVEASDIDGAVKAADRAAKKREGDAK